MSLKKGDKVTIPGEFEVIAKTGETVTIRHGDAPDWRPELPENLLRKVPQKVKPGEIWLDGDGDVWLIRPEHRRLNDGMRAWHINSDTDGWGETRWEKPSPDDPDRKLFPEFITLLYEPLVA